MARLLLEVDGARYSGWKEIRVRRSLEQLCDTFKVKYIDAWGSEPYPIQEGDAVRVMIERENGELVPVITGYVDDADQGYDKSSHDLEVRGRSKLGDFVDCTPRVTRQQVRGADFLKLANDLCEPFGITASAASGVDVGGEIRRFVIQPNETGENALRRVAAHRGLVMTSDTDGNLVLTRGSAAQPISTALVEGKNIESARYSGSWRNRHSEYQFRSQMQPDDDWNGDAANPVGTVSDDAITRYRPMAVLAEHQGDRKDLERRATWERNARAGKGQRLTVTVPGWEHADGLWEPNTLVPVSIPFLRIDDQMLVGAVEFQRSRKSGTVSVLDLVGPGAFDVLGAPPKLRKRRRT